MTGQELVDQLTALIAEHGDHEVVDDVLDTGFIAVEYNEDGPPAFVLVNDD